MATIREILTKRFDALLADYPGAKAGVAPTADARFGDYQSNVAMVLAKQLKTPPRALAEKLVAGLEVTDLCEPPEIAGAGFINFRLRHDFLERQAALLNADDRLGVAPVEHPLRIVLDFSSPNVAKPMHVGHIRSTILGDCLCRIARFLGHEVIADNHIGDWGTQFGKVIYGWKHFLDSEALQANAISELVRLYREVNTLEEADPAVKTAAREELVKLQQGDPENLDIWKQAVELSWQEFQKMYDLLDVHFDERLGESAYHDALAPLCEKLTASGLAEVSEGALCIFFRDLPALADKPAMIRKGDGGFLYATTDLATIEFRIREWKPDAIWYVVGMPQSLHFQQIFAAAVRMGAKVDLQHIAFGSILGEDRKIMRTRAGENVGLAEVLSESIERARAVVAEKNPDLPAEEMESIARTIGLGAVKYAELSQNRLTDYVFSWERMLSFQGNTAPYLQNAHVRIRSIFRKLEGDFDPSAPIRIDTAEERALTVKLLQYGEIVPLVLEDFRPNLLANYLFELADTFHSFYEACPVLKAEEAVRVSRLTLCHATAKILRHGLDLLGIACPERM